jgi:hypothetical protein
MHRLILAILLMAAGSATVSAAEGVPYGESVVFSAFRNGQPIGTHALAFQQQGGQLIVSTSIDFAVRVLGITAYRYSHRSREIWNGDDLQSITTLTEDDGKHYAVRARQEGTGLVVERETPGAVVNDQGLQRGGPIRETLPSGILPSTHWNMKQTRQSHLLNSQKGTLERIEVVRVGRETVKTVAGTVDATRYSYSGGIRMDQWFDDRGRWVKSLFVASDGSTIEYLLQE